MSRPERGAACCSAERFAAQSIPLLVVLRDGREIDRVVGAVPPATLEARLAPLLAPI